MPYPDRMRCVMERMMTTGMMATVIAMLMEATSSLL
jgi:hypothetical protein